MALLVPNRRLRLGLAPWSFGFFMSQGSAVCELGRRYDHAHANSITVLEVGSHCVGAVSCDLPRRRHAASWPSCSTADVAFSRGRYPGIRCLGVPLFWQPVSGIVAAMACHSWLVYGRRCDIIFSIVRRSMEPTAASLGLRPLHLG